MSDPVMSDGATEADAAPRPRASADGREARRAALRLAFAASAGFALSVAFDWTMPFLAPILAMQLLLQRPGALDLRQGVGLVAAVAVCSGFALLLSGVFAPRPASFVVVVAAFLFVGFLLQARGVGVGGLLVVTFIFIPIVATRSAELAGTLAQTLVAAAAFAVILVALAHAAFPAAAADRATPAPPAAAEHPVQVALASTLILLPLEIAYLASDENTAIVVVATVAAILQQAARGLATRTTLGLVAGNTLGGVAAAVIYELAMLRPSLVMLFLLVLLVGLWLAGRMSGPTGPVYAVALSTFLIVLGIGLVPLTGSSSEISLARIASVMLAGAYAAVGITLLMPRASPPTTPGDDQRAGPDALSPPEVAPSVTASATGSDERPTTA